MCMYVEWEASKSGFVAQAVWLPRVLHKEIATLPRMTIRETVRIRELCCY